MVKNSILLKKAESVVSAHLSIVHFVFSKNKIFELRGVCYSNVKDLERATKTRLNTGGVC